MLWSSQKLLIFKYRCLFHSTFPERQAIIDHAIPEAIKKMDTLNVMLTSFFFFFFKSVCFTLSYPSIAGTTVMLSL